jgi:signal transduction histidine kinase/CheY-like chemotaxis protein
VASYEEFLAAIHPEDREKFQRGEAEGLRERRSTEHEFRIVRPDGTMRWIQGRNTPFYNSTGQFVRQIGVEQDVTDRKRAESRVALQHAVTRVLAETQPLEPTMGKILGIIAGGLDASYSGFWTLERPRQSLRCAQLWSAPTMPLDEFTELTRATEFTAGTGLPGRLLEERGPVFVEEAELTRSENDPRRFAAAHAGLRGACGFPILLRTENFGVVEFFTTESVRPEPELFKLFGALGTQIGQFIERQRLEEQYRHSQKMEAVGTLAGGIAHDFNNILTGISGYCELAQIESEPGSPVVPHLQAVKDGARRATELVRQIMAFSRQQQPRRQALQLSDVVDEAMKLLRATIPATIEIKTHYDENLPLVLADPTSVHQVVVNLGTNASHAMKDRPGRLDVSLARVEVDADFVEAHPGLRAGPHVRLIVSDTGTGMDAATLARIFEPFFTTKGPGEGTGLGLAVVHGIVKSHDGGVFVYSQPGLGTKFQVYFPVHAGASAGEPGATARVPRGHGERILYVDDEALLARMGRQILQRLGYVAETYEDPMQALAAFRSRPAEFKALVTDLTMPGMTGLELARQVQRIRSDLPIILMSGYTATLTPEKFREMGIREFLMKPHSVDSLGTAIHRVLTDETEG